MAKMISKWISTTEGKVWNNMHIASKHASMDASEDALELTGEKLQVLDGFGGCFNELGWTALMRLDEEQREGVLSELFDPDMGCKFNFCRLPIGASDYAVEWYSHNENDGDYLMERFSIDRDRLYLLPYIKEAKKRRPDMKLFASPWSPPTWMKSPKAHNFGRLNMDRRTLDAYALYFKKFIEAYKDEAIEINQLHVQNEPFADQKFPSCLWTGEQFKVFIRDHLGPLFEGANIPTEIWFGTLNGPTGMQDPRKDADMQDYDAFVDRVLFDNEARKYIKGVGYQWAGKQAIQRTHESFPELKLMQTENECGEGRNTWDYARYVFSLIRHYLGNGANAYIYWNMVLEPNGASTWGWHQNSLITVQPGKVIYNPEFYVMKHFSHFVAPGAVRLGTKGHWTGASLAFENPNGDTVVIVSNALDSTRGFTLKVKDTNKEISNDISSETKKAAQEKGVEKEAVFSFDLEPYSFNTFVISGK